MALLTPISVGIAGATPNFVAVAASDTIAATGSPIWLEVKNASGTADTVAIVDAGKTPAGSSATNPTVTVPITTGDKVILIPASTASSTTGLTTITHTQTASVTCCAFTF